MSAAHILQATKKHNNQKTTKKTVIEEKEAAEEGGGSRTINELKSMQIWSVNRVDLREIDAHLVLWCVPVRVCAVRCSAVSAVDK